MGKITSGSKDKIKIEGLSSCYSDSPLLIRPEGGTTPLDPPGDSWALNHAGRNMSSVLYRLKDRGGFIRLPEFQKKYF